MWGVGGIPRHALDLSKWLRSRGHSVRMAGSPGDWLNETKEPGFVSLDLHQVTGDRQDASAASRIAALARSVRTLRAWLRNHPTDVIHAHESAPALVARLAALGMNIPVAVTYHGSDLARIRQFALIARACADKTITTNRHSAADLVTLGRLPSRRIEVIGLGVTAPPVSPERAAQARRRLLGDGKLLVVTIARLTEQKAIDVLVDVVRRVIAERPDIRFAVVGDGPLAREADDWSREAKVEQHLHFLGRSDEPMLYLQASDLFLLTSRWEALPYVIVEGFAAGLPAVSTDCGGVTELIDHEVGYVTAIGDAEALARGVLRIAGDPALRERMSRNAAERSREDRFTHEYNNRRIEGLYHELDSTRRRRRNPQ